MRMKTLTWSDIEYKADLLKTLTRFGVISLEVMLDAIGDEQCKWYDDGNEDDS